MCTQPLFKIKDLSKIDKKNGKPSEFFGTMKDELKLRTLWKPPKYIVNPIPCGKCIECKLEHARNWAARCLKESQQFKNNIMMTLTYNDENLTYGTYFNEDTREVISSPTLIKADYQKFLKKLRKKYPGLRYYMCGEYGELTERPHYHIIFFNLKINDMIPYKRTKCEWGKQSYILYKSNEIDKIWGKGFVDLNEVNYETCCYVARYVTKKFWGKMTDTEYWQKGKMPPFTEMSRRPGIGANYFFENKEKFKNNENFYVKTQKGLQETNGGRYFQKLLEKYEPDAYEKVKEERRKRSQQFMEEILKNTSLNLDEYRENKHEKQLRKQNKMR